MNRNLDGIFFRVNRDNKWQNICFSDLTEDEQSFVMEDKNEMWLRSMCRSLAKVIRDIGDQFDIACAYDDDEDFE